MAKRSAQFVAFLGIAACGPAKTQERVAPPAAHLYASSIGVEPIRDAAIQGVLRDSKTHEHLAGATIVAKPTSDGVQETITISDDAGQYRLLVPAGTHHVIVYYADTMTERRDVEVKAHEVKRIDIEIHHDAVAAAAEAAEYPECPAVVGQPAVSPADIDRLAADVLARGSAAIPEAGLLADDGPIYVAADVGGHLRLTTAALPKGGSKRLALRTMQELQAEADRTGTDFKYIRFSKLEIAGSCATVNIGVSIMAPSRSNKTFLCCCTATDLYEKRNGRWAFRTNVITTCA